MDYTTLASQETITKTTEALKHNNFSFSVVSTKEEAFEKVTEHIPAGASVMNGASQTLAQIGYVDYLKSGTHPWNNLHEGIVAEADAAKQAQLRRQATLSDYYVGSVHALTEAGELVIASNSGSQLPHIVFTSPNVIFVVGAQKIVPTLSDAFRRIEETVIPLEDERMKGVYGFGTTHTKTVILHKENAMMGRKVHVIIVNEKLGF